MFYFVRRTGNRTLISLCNFDPFIVIFWFGIFDLRFTDFEYFIINTKKKVKIYSLLEYILSLYSLNVPIVPLRITPIDGWTPVFFMLANGLVYPSCWLGILWIHNFTQYPVCYIAVTWFACAFICKPLRWYHIS